MNETEALSQHSADVHCLRQTSDLIPAAWLGHASLSDQLYPPGSNAAAQPSCADLADCEQCYSIVYNYTHDTHTVHLGELKKPLVDCADKMCRYKPHLLVI